MKAHLIVLALASLGLLPSEDTLAASCRITDSRGSAIEKQHDPLFEVLTAASPCPQNVLAFKEVLQQHRLTSVPTMVANRGRHNPRLGSFSFFEQVQGQLFETPLKPGDFTFGHFTTIQNDELALDQASAPGKLLIELIAWDEQKQLFNFYELIGDRDGGARWFYRGDSFDALKDNQNLHRALPPGQARFGQRMRCSGCHTSGGPIMKELAGPHNDWWTFERPLALGNVGLSADVKGLTERLADAQSLSQAVVSGTQKLFASSKYQALKGQLSLQEQLRPLFCETEINIVSDRAPFAGQASTIEIPSAFFVNPMLGKIAVEVEKTEYQKLLQNYRMQFPETSRRDADHAWLTPVKGFADLQAIEELVSAHVISEQFALNVLAIDLANPLFSQKRCDLLQQLPTKDSPHWQEEFAANLQKNGSDGALELWHALRNADEEQSPREKAQRYLSQIAAQTKNPAGVDALFQRLLRQRQAVFDNQISQNPRGQILEPGFRVIFPVPSSNRF